MAYLAATPGLLLRTPVCSTIRMPSCYLLALEMTSRVSCSLCSHQLLAGLKIRSLKSDTWMTGEFGGDLEEHLKDKAAEDAKQAAGTQASTEEEEEKLIEEMKKELAAPKFQIDETPAEQKEWK